MKTVKLLALAVMLAASPACKKDPKKQEPAKTDTTGSAAATPTPTPDQGSAAAATPTPTPPPAADTADWIKVYATHVAPNENDPVEVAFEKIKVVKADFDPAKIEGGTAQLEVDLASLKTSDPKRDDHLRNADYLETSKFATATIDIGNVKKKDGQTYTADAKISLHGAEKTYPVTFEVVEAKDDWIRIKGEHTFKRLDFNIGKKPGTDPKKGEDGVADELTAKLQLTLKKT